MSASSAGFATATCAERAANKANTLIPFILKNFAANIYKKGSIANSRSAVNVRLGASVI